MFISENLYFMFQTKGKDAQNEVSGGSEKQCWKTEISWPAIYWTGLSQFKF